MPPRAITGSIWDIPDPLDEGRYRSSMLAAANAVFPGFGRASGWRSWAEAIDPLRNRSIFGNYLEMPQYRSPSLPTSFPSFDRDFLPPQWTYDPFAVTPGLSYEPTQRGVIYQPVSMLLSSRRAFDRDVLEWLAREHPEKMLWGEGTLANPGMVTNLGGDWEPVDRWNDQVLAAVRKVYQETSEAGNPVYVPPNLVKALMKTESSGNPSARSDAGAIGLMQVMPFWFDQYGIPEHERYDPYVNILMGVRILAHNFQLGNPENPEERNWEWAVRRYFGLGGSDIRGTTGDQHWFSVLQNWNALTMAAPTSSRMGFEVGLAGQNIPGFEMFDDEVNAEINEAARRFGVPANLLKAMIRVESGGQPYSGTIYFQPRRDLMIPYVGIYQRTAQSHGLDWNAMASSRAGAIQGMAQLLRIYANMPEVGGRYGWQGVVSYYFSGNPNPENAFVDELRTPTSAYVNSVMTKWSHLDLASGVQSSRQVRPVTNLQMIWGGFDAPISQEFGDTDWARQNPGMYRYTTGFTRDRSIIHGGLDIGIASWTPLYSPVAGTVVIAGGSGDYCDPGDETDIGYGCGPGVGELRIRVAGSADEVILGHMRQIKVKKGQEVVPGQFVGYSGNMNGGHLHLEYRRWVGKGVTEHGWELVDPRLALTGVFVGTFGEVEKPLIPDPGLSWRGFVRAAVEGRPLVGHGVGGFYDWIRNYLRVGSAPRLLEPPAMTSWHFGEFQPS